MHVPIMIIISPALLLSARKQRICVLVISILISIYFMAKMVYQIEYIKHSYFDVNCTKVSVAIFYQPKYNIIYYYPQKLFYLLIYLF